MKRLLLMTAVSLCVVPALYAEDLKLNNETTVSFASQDQARALLGVEDEFIKSLSPFDRSARMKTDREVTPGQFLKFVAASALDWKPEEQRAVEAAVKAMAPAVAKLNLKFPESVLMIKTTGKEEGDASYTRGNAIILPQSVLSSGRGKLEHTIAHELFHILTRNHPELRDALYAIIGFLPCNEIELPGELKARKITNPDAPRNDHYIRVSFDGKPASVVPILYAEQPQYDVKRGGEFFEYMLIRLLVVEKQDDQWKPVLRNGQAVCLEERQVSQFLEQVGKNTEFTYHPEEILADNFALIVTGRKNLPSPEVAAKLDRLLRSATLPYTTSAAPPVPAKGARTSMKGWELYVWQANGETSFSLLEGTNRLKTEEEVTKAAVKGVDAIKSRLAELKAGETVSIVGRQLQEKPPADQANDLAEYCKKIGLQAQAQR